LERGLAMICAERIALDRRGTVHDTGERKPSVFERAWSHFGRELASSEPEEWSWFAHYKDGTRELSSLYLKRGDGAWWSFSGNLDRPAKSQVNISEARLLKRKRGDRGANLQSLAGHHATRRRALKRALRSVHARLGHVDGGVGAGIEVG
jgi:hypothetical protein